MKSISKFCPQFKNCEVHDNFRDIQKMVCEASVMLTGLRTSSAMTSFHAPNWLGLLLVMISIVLSSTMAPPAVAEEKLDVPVFYATDRQLAVSDSSNLSYNKQIPNSDPIPAGKTINLNYGIKNVEVEDKFASDASKTYSKYGWHLSSTPAPVGFTNSTFNEEQFFQEIKNQVDTGYAPHLVAVMVHGCCSDFSDGIAGAAVAARELGVPVVSYCWAAERRNLNPIQLFGYIPDELANQKSTERFRAFISRLESEIGTNRIVLISHSMGNRLVDDYLTNRWNNFGSNLDKPKFAFTVMGCADVDADQFAGEHLKHIAFNSGKTWIFFNNSDVAFGPSAMIHGNFVRVGSPHQFITKLITTDKVDCVDHHPINGRKHDLPVRLISEVCLKKAGWQDKVEQIDTHLLRAKVR